MAILNTFTTIEPLTVSYPRLNGTMPLDGVQVEHSRSILDTQGLDLMNKTEACGFGGAIGLLFPKQS